MTTVYFRCKQDAAVVEVELIDRFGAAFPATLLVDSGYTGGASLLIDEELKHIGQQAASIATLTGAVAGTFVCKTVECQITGLPYLSRLSAAFADLSHLNLPNGICGIAGLKFLQQFPQWGAFESPTGEWSFFLSNEFRNEQ